MKIAIILFVYFLLSFLTTIWLIFLDRTSDNPLIAFDYNDVYDSVTMLAYYISGTAWPVFIPICVGRVIARRITKRPYKFKKIIIMIVELLILLFNKEDLD